MPKVPITASRNINYSKIGLMLAGVIELLLGGFALFLPAIFKSFYGGARTPREIVIDKYYFPLSVVLIVMGVLCFAALLGLNKLKKWAGILAVSVCAAGGIFFIWPFQPLADLPTSLINIGTLIFICSGWQALKE